ncbi:GTP-binding protein [Dactylosporangium siamense]|uniref:Tetracycline resistance protein, tetM/tetO subfamily n=1 Tax=Dactylosporangium siamense TaxID=685454 RepID=A0A919UIG6_9ACTN|nr:TetM/TetW/TetO/TetS family tetracycline resistance ribosomal protection protein [Dactylosporangium siamense]GIG52615.1 tetracycline resistance protein, tetM/tetO subfamily [Dactylosporangium siamense]
MRTLNLGILAHVDAGKTSLTERLLHAAGVIDEPGSVDDGNTQTDTLALERRRGITIKSAVVSFHVGPPGDEVTVNLIDTPGHPDFIAEVERVLSVLDGAVLVVSAVEGVQAQTRILMRTLRRLRIPTIVFVNKIDRSGARGDGILRELAERLTPALVPMGAPTGLGTRAAGFVPVPPPLDVLAEHDDALLAAFVEGAAAPLPDVHRVLAEQTARTQVHPVYFGSAITGAGLDALTEGITAFLPAATGDTAEPVSGSVFKVERGPAGDRIAYVRMFAGTMKARERVLLSGGVEAKVTGIAVFDDGGATGSAALPAGRIGKVWGLGGVRIGDAVGTARQGIRDHHFAPPSLEAVVEAVHPQQRGPLYAALTELAEQDPLIDVRHDDARRETSVSLYGEVQKEVIQATLAEEYGLEVTFRDTTTICVERPAGTGDAFEVGEKDGNPFLATIGLRVEPAPAGAGNSFRLGVEAGAMPAAFFTAVQDTVGAALTQGLHGWQVEDCTVTMTRSGYWPRQSHAHQQFDKSMSSTGFDFRSLTPLVLMTALRRAGTVVHEPVHRFRLEAPADQLGALLPVLSRLQAVPRNTVTRGAVCVLDGDIPAARVHELQVRLPGLTRGEGVLESAFDRYEPVAGVAPSRSRTDHNPLDREEYLLRVVRRVT